MGHLGGNQNPKSIVTEEQSRHCRQADYRRREKTQGDKNGRILKKRKQSHQRDTGYKRKAVCLRNNWRS